MITRRDAIKRMGAAAGAVGLSKFLPACSSDDDGPVGITTYVFMMMENRSFDHLFGSRIFTEGLAGDGPDPAATNNDLDGNPVALHEAVKDHMCDPDPAHGWDESHVQWNGGLQDGFVTTTQMAHPGSIDPMQYLTREHVPVSYALADNYTICDRWFCSVMGPTWPNRFYWFAADCFGLKDDTLPSSLNQISIFHRLQDKGIDWAYYYGNIPVVAAIEGLNDLDTKVRRYRTFADDAKAGTLPPIVYIDPSFASNDDHPPVHPINGQELIAQVYQALAESPQWKNCLLIITYDEHGGFYDHVSPPQVPDDDTADGFGQLGFRVPAIVIGPYVKQNYVSSVQYDHTSPLKHIQDTFGTERLTTRSDNANTLEDCIDMERLAKGDWAKPITLPTIDVSEWPMDPTCFPTSYIGTDPINEWANKFPDHIAQWDDRKNETQNRLAIRDYLVKRGLYKQRK
ncbi:MAG: alkaline phosphatase family protein [Kofleriaceae bacterium]